MAAHAARLLSARRRYPVTDVGATVRIVIEVVEGGAREGAERTIEIPDGIDWSEYIAGAMTAATDEIEFLKIRKDRQWKN
jgi:hypothetical protein